MSLFYPTLTAYLGYEACIGTPKEYLKQILPERFKEIHPFLTKTVPETVQKWAFGENKTEQMDLKKIVSIKNKVMDNVKENEVIEDRHILQAIDKEVQDLLVKTQGNPIQQKRIYLDVAVVLTELLLSEGIRYYAVTSITQAIFSQFFLPEVLTSYLSLGVYMIYEGAYWFTRSAPVPQQLPILSAGQVEEIATIVLKHKKTTEPEKWKKLLSDTLAKLTKKDLDAEMTARIDTANPVPMTIEEYFCLAAAEKRTAEEDSKLKIYKERRRCVRETTQNGTEEATKALKNTIEYTCDFMRIFPKAGPYDEKMIGKYIDLQVKQIESYDWVKEKESLVKEIEKLKELPQKN